MWIVSSDNAHVEAKFLAEALEYGYQNTTIYFKYTELETSTNNDIVEASADVEASINNTIVKTNDVTQKPKKFLIAVPFPWATNKENGSLQITESHLFD